MDPADEFHSPYTYGPNNPINGIDPDGRAFFPSPFPGPTFPCPTFPGPFSGPFSGPSVPWFANNVSPFSGPNLGPSGGLPSLSSQFGPGEALLFGGGGSQSLSIPLFGYNSSDIGMPTVLMDDVFLDREGNEVDRNESPWYLFWQPDKYFIDDGEGGFVEITEKMYNASDSDVYAVALEQYLFGIKHEFLRTAEDDAIRLPVGNQTPSATPNGNDDLDFYRYKGTSVKVPDGVRVLITSGGRPMSLIGPSWLSSSIGGRHRLRQ